MDILLVKQSGFRGLNKCPQSKLIIMISFFTLLLFQTVSAESFLESLLKFTGISEVKSNVGHSLIVGNIWKMSIDKSGVTAVTKITREGTYHSPVWIPESDKMLVIKNDKLTELNVNNGKERIIQSLDHSTILIGFDKSDNNSLLILQKNNPAMIFLDTGELTFLPFDTDNTEDLETLDTLQSSFRDYGDSQVYVEEKKPLIGKTNSNNVNKIHMKIDKKYFVVACPAECAQPALKNNRKLLLFVGKN